MHKSVRDFIHRVKTLYPEVFENESTIEFGSLNINGSPREFFNSKNYIGVDAKSGDCVDKVSLCHEYKGHTDKSFDTVISTEMLEHDPYWDLSVDKMVSLVKDCGSLIITAGGRHRHPHGQTTYTPIERYYRNITCSGLLQSICLRGRFKKICLENNGDVDLLLFCYWRY